jgi:2-dehydrotetronate isomerase
MPRFSACIATMFGEYDFLGRFGAARAAGFDAVECWFPYQHSRREIQARLADLDLVMVVINTARGTGEEYGLAALPGREETFRASVDEALEYAAAFGNAAVHVMAGFVSHLPRDVALNTYKSNLEQAVRRAEGTGIQLLIEPLNGIHRPGYLLSSVEQAAEIIESTGLHDLKIMFDCWHVEMEEGDLINRMHHVWPKIGHIQFAGVPDRGPPPEGRVDYVAVFDEIDRLGWTGWVGAEYRPHGATHESLDWFRPYRARQARPAA